MKLSYIHGGNLIFGMLGLYALAIVAWTAICYWLIKFWQDRKKKK